MFAPPSGGVASLTIGRITPEADTCGRPIMPRPDPPQQLFGGLHPPRFGLTFRPDAVLDLVEPASAQRARSVVLSSMVKNGSHGSLFESIESRNTVLAGARPYSLGYGAAEGSEK